MVILTLLLNIPSSTNILGLVVFAVVTGIAIAQCGEDGLPLLRFFESVSIVMMKVGRRGGVYVRGNGW